MALGFIGREIKLKETLKPVSNIQYFPTSFVIGRSANCTFMGKRKKTRNLTCPSGKVFLSYLLFITPYPYKYGPKCFLLTVMFTLLLSNGLVDTKFIASSGNWWGTYKVVPSNVFTSK